MNIIIHNETPADIDAITQITIAAFKTCPYSRQTEQFIITALRKAGALTVSLVAEVEGKVVGHIAFSPATISDGSAGWYGLGPVSVVPELQRRGIGKALMREGLSRLKALGAAGCVLVGDPGYYEQFGFRSFEDLGVAGVPPQYVLALSFGESHPRGTAIFHEAFTATS